MSDSPVSHATNDDSLITETDSQQNHQNARNDKSVDDHQGIFDQRFSLFMNQFGETCETEHVHTAIAIVLDPQIPSQPLIFTRGSKYEGARTLAMVLRHLKREIDQELSIR